ncbi:hypothetical protein IJ135_01155 [Candidatus Saccharibacteria bacterium]|nr:hypothetical protein [Candidatus Saccharibacteria bacterium]
MILLCLRKNISPDRPQGNGPRWSGRSPVTTGATNRVSGRCFNEDIRSIK